VLALVLSACGSVLGSSSTSTPTAVPATATPAPPDLTVFRNFIYPIKGGCLPENDSLMPNAPRPYRGGVHEGVDFYDYDNCTKILKGTPIVAAKDGVVIRADRDYHALTQAELEAADNRVAEGHANDPDVIDLFRGRQVWIDHGRGIVTRYAHASDIPDNIRVGTQVVAGEVVAFVGDSGTPESLSNPDTELHLHFELRTGDSFLGKGLPPDEVRQLYEKLFTPLDAP
jgi:murein DD-endopeptidase MepM/ murein hydrolase activator NlpD